MIVNIINDEILKLINEYYNYDSYYDSYFTIRDNIINDFFYNNTPDFKKNMPWNIIKFNRLKKIWEDYIRTGVVRDVKGLDDIKSIMINNVIKITIITELAGHTSNSYDDYFNEIYDNWFNSNVGCLYNKNIEDFNKLINTCHNSVHPFIIKYLSNECVELPEKDKLYTIILDKIKDRFFYYYCDDPKHEMGGYISDYGLMPLHKLLKKLLENNTPENDVLTIDAMLNVIHQRSDIANWFIEGSSSSLNSLSDYTDDGNSKISGKYNLNNYYN